MLGGMHGPQFAKIFSRSPQTCSLLKLLVSKKVSTMYYCTFLFLIKICLSFEVELFPDNGVGEDDVKCVCVGVNVCLQNDNRTSGSMLRL